MGDDTGPRRLGLARRRLQAGGTRPRHGSGPLGSGPLLNSALDRGRLRRSREHVGLLLLGRLGVRLGRLRRGFVAGSAVLRPFVTFCAAALAFSLEGAYLAFREGRWPGLGGEISAAFYTALTGAAFHSLLDSYRSRLGWSRDRFFA